MRTLMFALVMIMMSTAYGQDKQAFNIDNSNIGLDGYSPVSYLDLGLAQRGVKEFHSEYEKVLFYFTSAEQKNTFDENPEKYLPQYGGYCAFGVYVGAKFRPDPNKFLVLDGKYYLYLYNLELDAQQLWMNEKDQNLLVETADKNWGSLQTSYN